MNTDEIMGWINTGLNIAPVVIAVASAIAAITPTEKDNLVISWLRRIVDVLALNIGQAKRPAPTAAPPAPLGLARLTVSNPAPAAPSKAQQRRQAKGGGPNGK